MIKKNYLHAFKIIFFTRTFFIVHDLFIYLFIYGYF